MQFIVEYLDGTIEISEIQDGEFDDLLYLLIHHHTNEWFKMDSQAHGQILIPMTSIKHIREL